MADKLMYTSPNDETQKYSFGTLKLIIKIINNNIIILYAYVEIYLKYLIKKQKNLGFIENPGTRQHSSAL